MPTLKEYLPKESSGTKTPTTATEKRRARRQRRKALTASVTGEQEKYVAVLPSSPFYTVQRLDAAHPIRESLSDDQWVNLCAATTSSATSNAKGRHQGPRAAIYDDGRSFDQLLDMIDNMYWNLHNTQDVWDPKMRGVLTHPAYSLTEEKQRTKFGPYLSALASEVAAKTSAYFGPDFKPEGHICDRIHRAIVNVAEDLVEANSGQYLTPVSIDEAYELMPKDKFYGYPHFTSKWAQDDTIVATTKDIATRISQLDDAAIQTYHDSPWVVFNRVVPNGYDVPKVRATMAPAKYGALFEKTFTHPVLQTLKLTEWGVGYQGNHVVGPIIQRWVRDNNTLFSMDYEAFDQHTMSYARECVRDVLVLCFEPEYSAHLHVMFNAFNNPGVILGRNVVYATDGFGLGSGIGPTGIIGTIWNRIIALCLMEMMNEEFGIEAIKHVGYGDDTLFCFTYDSHVEVEWFYNKLLQFGMVINKDKQEYSYGRYRYASFLALQYYWIEEEATCSEGVYSIYRAWARILFKDVQTAQEDKWVRAEYEGLSPVGCDMLDTIATLENCKGNPAFLTFVELVRDGHPLRLKSSHYLPASKLSTLTGEENKGLKSFSSVRHIIALEVAEGEAGTIDDIEWQRYCLQKFSKHVWHSKGILITAPQALDYLNGVNIQWDGQQLEEAAARGIAAQKPLSDRVRELELRKGVILNAAQIEDLRCNRKIRWTEGNRHTLQAFGQLTDPEKDLWRASHQDNLTVREVVNNRAKYDFDSLWHKVLLLLGKDIDEVKQQA